MGGLVFGGIQNDKIHINEKTVWNGGPTGDGTYNYGNTNPTDTEEDLQKIQDNLNAIREKLDDKSEYVFGFSEDSYQSVGTDTQGEAMDELNKLMGDLNGFDGPQDYANLRIITDGIDESGVTNYIRDLDMRTALATVSYDYDGVHYTREYLNSYPDNVLAVRLTADQGGKISFETELEDLTGGTAYSNTVDGDTITMTNALESNGLKTEAQLKVVAEGGSMTAGDAAIHVENADAATLILACGTDYKMELPNFRGEDPHAAVTERVNAAAGKGYEALKEGHVADHSALFSRLELGFNEEVPQIPTDELIQKYRNMVEGNGGATPTESEQRALEIMCYQFGRYLTIAGSREGALPTNLQGVWGEGSFAWGGDYHFNINVQMNYWPTMASNLGECLLPFNDYLSVLREAGRQAAASAFGIKSGEGEENGWLVGCFSTPYMYATMGQTNNAAGWNPIGSAWALLNSYEYYLYTGDTGYLSELYPSMKEVANFWNEALYWSEYQQRYVSAPSYSPENGPIVNGASYDQQFIWQHFENTIQAAEILGVDQDLVAEWREKQSKLDPVLVGDDGQVKEWFEETHIGKAQAGDLEEIDIPQWRQSLGAQSSGVQPPHRHLSQLMALYPCNIISKDNPEYMDAAIVSLNERGLDATGWSKAHKLNLWARTGHSSEAFQIVQSAVGGGNSGFLTNLFSSHGSGANYKEAPIFQIDGNFGYTAGVNEMLLQSQLGYVQFLPALPDQWDTGFINGIVARGNFVIDMEWSDHTADRFAVTSRNGGTFTGEYQDIASCTVTKADGTAVDVQVLSDDKISFATEAGEKYIIASKKTPEKLQKLIDEAKNLSAQMTDDLLSVQKNYLDGLIAAAEQVVANAESSKYDEQTQILNQANKAAASAIALKDCYYAEKEIYDGRDVNEDWPSYITAAGDFKNQLDAAEALLQKEGCAKNELDLMAKAIEAAEKELTGIWDKLIVTIDPGEGTLSADDRITLSSPFKDLQIRYTTDGNDPMGFSDEYTEPFAVTKSKETVKAALFFGNRQMSDVFTAEFLSSEALGTAEDLSGKYSSVTNEGDLLLTDYDGTPEYALDGKNYYTWRPSTFPAILTVEFEEPITVNTAEVALDWFWPYYYDIDKMDIEYWNGTEWVAALTDASLGTQSKIFTFDEFTSDKVRLNIKAAAPYNAYYGYIGVDAFRLFNLKDEVNTDKGELDQIISVANQCVEDGEVESAIPSVQESFNKVLEYAKAVSANIQSSQETIDNTTKALIEEIEKLELKAGDKTKLTEHYTLYSVYDLDLYIDGEAKDAFTAALEEAKKVIEDRDALEEDVTEADQKLLDAAAALVKKGDKTSLKALIDSTADYQEEDYLEGWSTFAAALAKANEVLANESATQEEVDEAKALLAEAITSLKGKADKTALEEAVENAKKIDLTGYSEASVAQFRKALEAAEAVLANEELSVYDQPTVDGAALDLQNAIDALEKKSPEKPSDPSGNQGGTGSGTNTGTGSGNGTSSNTNNNSSAKPADKATKTGDTSPILPVAAGMVLSVAAIVVVLGRRKRR